MPKIFKLDNSSVDNDINNNVDNDDSNDNNDSNVNNDSNDNVNNGDSTDVNNANGSNDSNEINDNANNDVGNKESNDASNDDANDGRKFTQEELDQVLKTRLNREKEKLAAFENELNEKTKIINTYEEKMKKQEQEIFEGIKYKVAQETGLGVEIISALAGQSYEEILGNAKKIATVNNSNNVNKEQENFKIPSKDER